MSSIFFLFRGVGVFVASIIDVWYRYGIGVWYIFYTGVWYLVYILYKVMVLKDFRMVRLSCMREYVYIPKKVHTTHVHTQPYTHIHYVTTFLVNKVYRKTVFIF